jgi:hypothetical protein
LLQAATCQQFQDSSARKEGYSRQIQGFKQFQDSADRTRKKTPGRIQGSQRPHRKTKYNPEVHSNLAIKGGRIQTNHLILFCYIYCLNFIYLFNLLFLFYLFNIQFSDHSTGNFQQEDKVWTQCGFQELVDQDDQDCSTQVHQLLNPLHQVSNWSVQGTCRVGLPGARRES